MLAFVYCRAFMSTVLAYYVRLWFLIDLLPSSSQKETVTEDALIKGETAKKRHFGHAISERFSRHKD